MKIEITGYRARPGAGFSHTKAATYGRTLASIAERHGDLKPALVVEEARAEESPIHEVFEWDDSEAARLHRENQARRLMNRIDVQLNIDGRRVDTRAFINVFVRKDGEASTVEEAEAMVEAKRAGHANSNYHNAYRPAPKVIEAPELEAQYEAQALGELERWTKRYKGIRAIAEVVEKISEIIEETKTAAA